MADTTPRGVPVVIDEWAVQLWADSKIPPASAARLIALVDAELETASTELSVRVAQVADSSAPAWVEVLPR